MKALTMIRHLVFLALAGALFFLPACDDGGSGGKGSPMFVAVGDNGTICSTSDGSTWNNHTISPAITKRFSKVIYGDKFVAVAGEGMIYTSYDGEVWEEQESGISSSIHVAYGKGLYIAVGWNGLVLTSPDAVTWTNRSTGSDEDDMTSIVFGNNEFVAVGAKGLVKTTDGVLTESGLTWQDYTQTSLTAYRLNNIAYGKGRYVVLLPFEDMVYSSPAAITNASFTLSFDNDKTDDILLKGLAFGNNEFIAVGTDDVAKVSSDGTASSWVDHSPENLDTGYGCYDVAYGNGRYIMVGDLGGYQVSTNGEDWTMNQVNIGLNNFNAIAYGSL